MHYAGLGSTARGLVAPNPGSPAAGFVAGRQAFLRRARHDRLAPIRWHERSLELAAA